ncbi:hypothetical protein N2152v2_011248 [Parachlorella kessleri]
MSEGAGVSAESGIPTFRGAGGLWRTYEAASLATPEAFVRNPLLVWEFYSWRREVVARSQPNPAHYALAALERKLEAQGRRLTLITQNVDRLHQAAGSRSTVELHGSLWDVCVATRRGLRDPRFPPWEDRTQPLVPALAGKGQPHHDAAPADIPTNQLPRDSQGRLLRPGVVWFGEQLPQALLAAAEAATAACDLFVTVGTAATVYPAAGFASSAAARGVPVAEFNLEPTGSTALCTWAFQGRAGELLPAALGVEQEFSGCEEALSAVQGAEQDVQIVLEQKQDISGDVVWHHGG